MLVGEGDVKATDFLTTGYPGSPPSTSASGEPGLGGSGEGLGGLEEGALPLSPHKIQVPPATFLAQRET